MPLVNSLLLLALVPAASAQLFGGNPGDAQNGPGSRWLQAPAGSIVDGFLKPFVNCTPAAPPEEEEEPQAPAPAPLREKAKFAGLFGLTSWVIGSATTALVNLVLQGERPPMPRFDPFFFLRWRLPALVRQLPSFVRYRLPVLLHRMLPWGHKLPLPKGEGEVMWSEVDNLPKKKVEPWFWSISLPTPLIASFVAGVLAWFSQLGKRWEEKGPILPVFKGTGPPGTACGVGGKGGGKGGKGGGKGKAPPPPGSAAAPKAAPGAPPPKAKSKAKAKASPTSSSSAQPESESPFGKKIHWIQPDYGDPAANTVFGRLKAVGGRQFDEKLLTTIFAENSHANKRKSWTGTKVQGKCLLDTQRAQGAAIMVNKLKMSTEELATCVNTLSFDNPNLNADDIEIVGKAMPNPQEAKKLLECKHEVEALRDIEQKLMPLCDLSPSRLRLVKFGMANSSLHSGILKRCRLIQRAAEEAHQSTQFMEFLRLSLQVGNFINHGEKEMRQGMVRAFALESLNLLSTCKAGPMSALHFVCLTLRSEDPNFMQGIRSSLQHVRDAAREKVAALEADVSAFGKEVEFAKGQLKVCAEGDQCRPRVEKLVDNIGLKDGELKLELSKALRAVTEVQAYFNVSVRKGGNPPTSEQFFSQIVSTLDSLQNAWREVEKNGSRWQNQFEGGDEVQEVDLDTPLSARTKVPKRNTRRASVPDASPRTPTSDVPLPGKMLSADDDSDNSTPSEVTAGTGETSNKKKRQSCPAIAGPPSMPTKKQAEFMAGSNKPSPRLPKKIVEFHTIHDSDSDSGRRSALVNGMKRGATEFPGIIEFDMPPMMGDERTWDFQISGNSSYTMALWRIRKRSTIKRDRDKESELQEHPLYMRHTTL